MAEYFGTTVDHIFETQTERFRPEGAQGMDVVVAYDISGDGGGCWKLTVKDGACQTDKLGGPDFGAFTAKMIADAETFAGITVGKIDGMEAFQTGKLKVEGDMSILMKLPMMFTKYVPPKKALTAGDIIGTMPERFRPEVIPGLDARFCYDLGGDGGGQWTAVVKDGKCTIQEGLAADATVTNIVSAKDYVDLMTGKLDPLVAFGAGRLRLTGDMELAQKLPKLFAKFTLPEAEAQEELIVLKKVISVDMKYSTGPVMGKFLAGLREKKIIANVCPECGRKQLPPREICAVCRCRAGEFVEVGPEGKINLIEHVYYASPDPLTGETRETPYGTIHILLDGCQGKETFWHFLKDSDLGRAKKGDRVRPVWADKPEGRVRDIKYFELAD
jgi:putative sterol carrier protein/uncharacterized OB-fold protein